MQELRRLSVSFTRRRQLLRDHAEQFSRIPVFVHSQTGEKFLPQTAVSDLFYSVCQLADQHITNYAELLQRWCAFLAKGEQREEIEWEMEKESTTVGSRLIQRVRSELETARAAVKREVNEVERSRSRLEAEKEETVNRLSALMESQKQATEDAKADMITKQLRWVKLQAEQLSRLEEAWATVSAREQAVISASTAYANTRAPTSARPSSLRAVTNASRSQTEAEIAADIQRLKNALDTLTHHKGVVDPASSAPVSSGHPEYGDPHGKILSSHTVSLGEITQFKQMFAKTFLEPGAAVPQGIGSLGFWKFLATQTYTSHGLHAQGVTLEEWVAFCEQSGYNAVSK